MTGASAGNGRETARVLAREGANLALAARREGLLEAVVEGIESAHGTETLVMPTDVTDGDSVERSSTGSRTQSDDAVADLVDATAAQFGGWTSPSTTPGLASATVTTTSPTSRRTTTGASRSSTRTGRSS